MRLIAIAGVLALAACSTNPSASSQRIGWKYEFSKPESKRDETKFEYLKTKAVSYKTTVKIRCVSDACKSEPHYLVVRARGENPIDGTRTGEVTVLIENGAGEVALSDYFGNRHADEEESRSPPSRYEFSLLGVMRLQPAELVQPAVAQK